MLEPGKDFQFYNPSGDLNIYRQRLPHWRQPGALYFVTIRQSDSIPKEKLDLWQEQYRLWLLTPNRGLRRSRKNTVNVLPGKSKSGLIEAMGVASYSRIPAVR